MKIANINRRPPTNRRCNQIYVSYQLKVTGGGCFFRCIVASTSPELQRTNRDEHGKISNGIYRLLETTRSDKLRAEVVEFMVENMDEFDHDASIINADEPVHIRYANVQDRLTHMAMAMTMPGEMEVSAAAVYLEKTIVI